MALTLVFADYAVIFLMMSVSAGMGIYFRLTGGKQKTTQEFLMADKSMSILPVTISIVATNFSAVSALGLPAEAYMYGTQMLAKELSYPLGAAITAYYILPVYFSIDENSIYEIFYMPLVIYAPSLALSTLTGLSVWVSVISMTVVGTFYSTLGGLKAVLWTDLFKMGLMLLTIYCLIVKGSQEYGGFHKIFETAQKGQRIEFLKTSLDFTIRYTFWNTVVQGFVFGIYWCGAIFLTVQRLFSSGSLKKAQKENLL